MQLPQHFLKNFILFVAYQQSMWSDVGLRGYVVPFIDLKQSFRTVPPLV